MAAGLVGVHVVLTTPATEAHTCARIVLYKDGTTTSIDIGGAPPCTDGHDPSDLCTTQTIGTNPREADVIVCVHKVAGG
jgi:hypothetical protein